MGTCIKSVSLTVLVLALIVFATNARSQTYCSDQSQPRENSKANLKETIDFLVKFAPCVSITVSDLTEIRRSASPLTKVSEKERQQKQFRHAPNWQYKNAEGCQISFVKSTSIDAMSLLRVNLAGLDPGFVGKKEKTNSIIGGTSIIWSFAVGASDETSNTIEVDSTKIHYVTERSVWNGYQTKSREEVIMFRGRDISVGTANIPLGQRMENAFRHAVRLCGGKPNFKRDPF